MRKVRIPRQALASLCATAAVLVALPGSAPPSAAAEPPVAVPTDDRWTGRRFLCLDLWTAPESNPDLRRFLTEGVLPACEGRPEVRVTDGRGNS